jgi:glycosyltransferase involved in cell wall biosynthesis
MRILLVHNHYGRYATGGEAAVMQAEASLLEAHGHVVIKYERTNAEIEEAGLLGKIKVARDVAWSKAGYEAIKQVVDKFKPDVMHVHNYWFVLTPSIFDAAKNLGVATVLTLHNYRLICPGNQFLRNNKPCELCLDGNPYRVLWHRCYPGRSLLKSYLSLRLYLHTRKRGFLARWVDGYIALSEFGKKKFIEGGLPEGKLHIKPNFMSDPLHDSDIPWPGSGTVFVGRISPEKGLMTLMQAWRGINYPLTVIGNGPQMDSVKHAAPVSVVFAGQKSRGAVLEIIKKASFLVFPSDCYEGFPLSILEAMAVGKAVIATNLGPRKEIVHNGVTGMLFKARDPKDLRQKVQKLITDTELCVSMGKAGRQRYLQKYTPEKNYNILMAIYLAALKRSNGGKIS